VIDRDELIAREREAWVQLSTRLEAVPAELRGRPVLRDGWSPTSVVWHVAHWVDHQAGNLELVAGERSPEPVDIDVIDGENETLLEESRSVSWDEANARLATARGRILAAWRALPEVDDDAVERFTEDTFEHYEEHLPDLSAVVDGR
jgi:DinB family protein